MKRTPPFFLLIISLTAFSVDEGKCTEIIDSLLIELDQVKEFVHIFA